MENILELLLNFSGELGLGLLIIILRLFGQKKTAEELKQAKEKKLEKMKQKQLKRVHGTQKKQNEIDELEREIEQNA